MWLNVGCANLRTMATSSITIWTTMLPLHLSQYFIVDLIDFFRECYTPITASWEKGWHERLRWCQQAIFLLINQLHLSSGNNHGVDACSRVKILYVLVSRDSDIWSCYVVHISDLHPASIIIQCIKPTQYIHGYTLSKDIVPVKNIVLGCSHVRYLYKTSSTVFTILPIIEWTKFHFSSTVIT